MRPLAGRLGALGLPGASWAPPVMGASRSGELDMSNCWAFLVSPRLGGGARWWSDPGTLSLSRTKEKLGVSEGLLGRWRRLGASGGHILGLEWLVALSKSRWGILGPHWAPSDQFRGPPGRGGWPARVTPGAQQGEPLLSVSGRGGGSSRGMPPKEWLQSLG